ncbi:hypothetical protein Actkin_06188 [Actinokineospora sp. UTMC 2448]|nr:hypothetical protein Actkin_06188 [Actinokineospora sp. UTMC 2448]
MAGRWESGKGKGKGTEEGAKKGEARGDEGDKKVERAREDERRGEGKGEWKGERARKRERRRERGEAGGSGRKRQEREEAGGSGREREREQEVGSGSGSGRERKARARARARARGKGNGHEQGQRARGERQGARGKGQGARGKARGGATTHQTQHASTDCPMGWTRIRGERSGATLARRGRLRRSAPNPRRAASLRGPANASSPHRTPRRKSRYLNRRTSTKQTASTVGHPRNKRRQPSDTRETTRAERNYVNVRGRIAFALSTNACRCSAVAANRASAR